MRPCLFPNLEAALVLWMKDKPLSGEIVKAKSRQLAARTSSLILPLWSRLATPRQEMVRHGYVSTATTCSTAVLVVTDASQL